jgi:hypothetical protein
VTVRPVPNYKYSIKLQNISVALPPDIVTDKGKQHVMLDTKGMQIESKTMPVIDPEMFYIKKVIYE